MIDGIFAIFCILIGAFFTFIFSRENTDCNGTYIKEGRDSVETPGRLRRELTASMRTLPGIISSLIIL